MAPALHFERLPFKWMARASDGYLLRIAGKVVGSLSSSPLSKPMIG